MNDRQRELATDYLPLARAIAAPFKSRVPCAIDDFESAACLGLVEAAIRFRPERHSNFATYARRRIRGSLIDAWRGMRRLGYRSTDHKSEMHLSIDELSRDEESAISVEPKVEAEVAHRETLEYWIEGFSPGKQAVFRSIYIDGRSQSQTAKALGISKSHVCQMHREGIALLASRPDVVEFSPGKKEVR